mgnify:CR=1 FL=1
MVKDLIHYNLFGTPAYLRRIASLKENEEKRRESMMGKQVGTGYMRPSVTTAGEHAGVRTVAGIWKLASENAFEKTDTVGTDYRRPSISACQMDVKCMADIWKGSPPNGVPPMNRNFGNNITNPKIRI